jgi:uncharacterized protein with FMN-binding domain
MAIPRNLANLAPKLSATGGSFATTIGVGAATPAASGAGITFPATQSASSDANTLDDYEEGTWTGTLTGTVSNPSTAVTATGKYTKIGNTVAVQVFFENKNTSGASGDARVSGLPFSISDNTAGAAMTEQMLTFTGTTLVFNLSASDDADGL